jgi:general secretion pathway protein E
MIAAPALENPAPEARASSPMPLDAGAALRPEGRSLRELLDRSRPADGGAGDTQALLLALLDEAFRSNVSDIHLDPAGQGYDLRFRMDGVLRNVGTIDETRGLHLLRSLKSQAGLDPGFEMMPQSGRVDWTFEGTAASVRLATAPGVRGEKASLRLLPGERQPMPLHELGLSDKDHAELLKHIPDVRGMILVSGPTGSGKTTTLYALIRELRQTGRSIVTLEDPVEFVLQDITQIQINEKQGLDFTEGVKSLLRLDPDIIVMGEMRDASSARAALQASDAGHVCLSTLHARDAAGTITMLRNFGCLDHEIVAALDLIVSQRLVRRLCGKCRRQEPPTSSQRDFIVSIGHPSPDLIWRAVGCAECGGTGHKGRIGVFEVHRMRQEDADLILAHADERAIRALMRRRGVRSLSAEVLSYVKEGLTSLEEVRRGLGLGFFSEPL